MAHWAELDSNNKVIRVLVGNNNEADEGYSWLIQNLGGTWVQTSYNGRIRYNFAGIGYSYDEVNDAFIAPKCHDEAKLNNKFQWDCANQIHLPPEITA